MPALIIFAISTDDSLITTEYETVEVQIVDTYYRDRGTSVIFVGKTCVARTTPAKYEVTVKYNGCKYTVDDEATYERCKDSIGETVNATLEIRTHENGQVWYDIIELLD
jgi:hypothetical protein